MMHWIFGPRRVSDSVPFALLCLLTIDQLVDAVHQEFMDSLVRVFDLHKAAYGWADKELVIR